MLPIIDVVEPKGIIAWWTVLMQKLTKVNIPLKPFISNALQEFVNEMQKAVTNGLIFRSGINNTDKW